jgi:hypothetical protein
VTGIKFETEAGMGEGPVTGEEQYYQPGSDAHFADGTALVIKSL